MTHDDDIDNHGDNDGGDATLRMALRQLRRDRMPEHDLWPRIAAEISAAPVPVHARPARASRFVPWAIAASLLLAVGLAWQLRPIQPRDGEARLITHEAKAMTREYQGALKVIATGTPATNASTPALRELDASAAQIRSALARDPDARFLLDRLRHTYSLRLALTQRAALS
jgi:hypothetical protein